VVEVVDVDVVEVVDVEVVVDAAVVTGVVVVVTAADEVVVSRAFVDDVEPESVVPEESSLHATIANAKRTRGTRRIDFTPGSLARRMPIT